LAKYASLIHKNNATNALLNDYVYNLIVNSDKWYNFDRGKVRWS